MNLFGKPELVKRKIQVFSSAFWFGHGFDM